MIKIVVLFMVALLAIDGVYRDGHLIEVFLGQEMYLPFFTKTAYLIVAIVATLLLFHAIVWEFNLLPKPEEKKTDYQIKKEEEEEARRLEEEELRRLEEEALKAEQKRKEEEKRIEEERINNEGRKYLT